MKDFAAVTYCGYIKPMHIVIVGAGQAALQAIASLRQAEFDGALTLVGNEGLLPYQRPPLSKAYLSGKLERQRLFLKPQDFYADNKVTLELDNAATAINPDAHTLTLADGRTLNFDKLVLATGSRPRLLDIAGRHLGNIFDLRSMADIDAMQTHFTSGKHLVIIGGGYIGLEAAAVARELRLHVDVLEAAPRLLERVAAPEISAFYQKLHEDNGVTITTNAQVVGFDGEGVVSAVRFDDGTTLAADIVITGIGVVPNTQLAEAAGLGTNNGILVDTQCRTTHADIFACGDCTFRHNDVLGREMRLESVPNAIEQGKLVAAALLDATQPRPEVPWFWSDQYDVKLQIAGVPKKIDEKVLRGDGDSHSFAWFYFTDGQLTGCTAINRAAEFMAVRRLILEGRSISVDRLANEDESPKSWLQTNP